MKISTVAILEIIPDNNPIEDMLGISVTPKEKVKTPEHVPALEKIEDCSWRNDSVFS